MFLRLMERRAVSGCLVAAALLAMIWEAPARAQAPKPPGARPTEFDFDPNAPLADPSARPTRTMPATPAPTTRVPTAQSPTMQRPAAHSAALPAVDLPTITADGNGGSVLVTHLTSQEKSGAMLTLVNPSLNPNAKPASKSKSVAMYEIAKQGSDQWQVIAAKGTQRTPVGELSAGGYDLNFQWLSGVQRSLASELRNCVLQISSGGVQRYVGLRKPVKSPAPLLDLRRDQNIIPVAVDDLPDDNALWLDLLDLGKFPVVSTVPSLPKVAFKQPLRIVVQSATEDSPTVELDVLFMKNGSKLNVNIRPVAVATKGPVLPFTLKSVELASVQIGRQIETARAKVLFNVNEIPRLQAKIDSWNGALVKAADAAAIQAQMNKWAADIRNMQAENKQFDVIIPALEKQLAAMPGLQKLTGELHQQVPVRFRLVERVGELDVPLFDATSEAATSDPSKSTATPRS